MRGRKDPFTESFEKKQENQLIWIYDTKGTTSTLSMLQIELYFICMPLLGFLRRVKMAENTISDLWGVLASSKCKS